MKADWTDSYSFWSKWEDSEDALGVQNDNAAKEKATDASASFMGHDHDHSVERKLLDLSEAEKLNFCETHRRKGNYLFLESLFPKAAEQYQLALSYYEYCFPDDDETQAVLDTLRRACLCNISLCYYRMGYWRMALNAASQVLQEDENDVKALFRRAQAYRALDEYGFADADITKASRLCPTDKVILKEIQALQNQKKRALTAEKDLALNMLDSGYNHDHSAAATASTDQSAEIKARDTKEINHAVTDLFAISMPLEPSISTYCAP